MTPFQTFTILALLLIVALAGKIIHQNRRIRMNLADLKTKVDAQTTVIASAATAFSTLAQEIRDNANDPAAIQAIADEVDANTNALAAAVAANTAASSETPPAAG